MTRHKPGVPEDDQGPRGTPDSAGTSHYELSRPQDAAAGDNPLLRTTRQVLAFPFILLIRLYQLVISPWIGPKCRFTPTCSQYGIEALRKHGPIKGLWLTIRRVSRCHPWGGSGFDPVP